MENDTYVDVSDVVVVLVALGSDFESSDKDVLEFSLGSFFFDGVDEVVEVVIRLNVEAAIPLAIFVSEWNSFWSLLVVHGTL